ncbi:uncharacterized protein LOC104885245 [Rhizophagus irregularis DAOM 181602=DAOM 197198]|nr:uncharacterized protein LOC104885245 [Rhizophagus irregularis DAOM 181602=DAOM 197198]
MPSTSETPVSRKRRLQRERVERHRQRRFDGGRLDLGIIDQTCLHCGARFWLCEKDRNSSLSSPRFAMCCAGGKVRLAPVLDPPPYLLDLYTSSCSEAISFRKNIRTYNGILACTSFGANIDESFQGQGVSNFKIHGQIYHRVGSLMPDEGQKPVFAQLYIYDTDHENSNRLHVMRDLNAEMLQNLQNMLDTSNPYIQNFRQVRDLLQNDADSAEISMRIFCDRSNDARRYNAPAASNVAAIMVGDGYEVEPSNRDIVLNLRDGTLQRISELHPSYDPLQYVLLFPNGDDGWHLDIPLADNTRINTQRDMVTPMQFYSYRLQIRPGNCLQRAGRLYQQYVVDQYSKIEQHRLNYLRFNQSSLRLDLYKGIADAIHADDRDADDRDAGDIGQNIGRRIILPSTFIGGPRQMYQLYQDAMAIVSHFGKPDLFVTFTCNPKWQEVTRELLPHQTAVDRPDLTVRVFHMKLRELLKDLCEKHCLGKVAAFVYVIEFQKRGLPHAHILLILSQDSKLHSAEDYDAIVSAEIPDPNVHPLAYETVISSMMHGPCGVLNPSAPCMKDGFCQKHYPKSFQSSTQNNYDGYPLYRRRDNGSFVEVRRGVRLDNRWVVPHNVELVEKYDAHINVKICNSVLAIKYLYKYVYKGHDRATVALSQPDSASELRSPVKEPIDEIKMYLDARYISSSEAIWRIFHYRMHGRSPSVQRLAIHLPEKQLITFRDNDKLQQVLDHADSHVTTLVAWFQENAKNPAAHNYRYVDFPLYYTWNSTDHKWNIRKTATSAIGRLYMVQPSEGERYYLRMLLTHVRGASSFDDLKTVEGHVCGSFKEACIRLGLLQDDTEWDVCLREACCIRMGQQLRLLFATILIFCQPAAPEILWNNHKVALCEDILYQNRDLYSDVNDAVEQEALRQLESYLQLNAKSLKDFPDMPLFLGGSAFLDGPDALNQLIREEMSYDVTLLQSALNQNVPLLNKDQRAIYDAVLSSINDTCNCFFVDGPGGTGKTFLYNTLLATVRSRGEIALAVASSGISALLIDGGRTAYSRFRIPLKLDELSTCNISRGSRKAR